MAGEPMRTSASADAKTGHGPIPAETTGYAPIPAETNRVAREVVDASFHVHAALGPGLLESVYTACLAYELTRRGLHVEREVVVPIVYDGVRLDDGLRLDLLVNECVVVEVKAVEALIPVHQAQILTYLKLTGHRLGLLVNFNTVLIRDGIKRMVR